MPLSQLVNRRIDVSLQDIQVTINFKLSINISRLNDEWFCYFLKKYFCTIICLNGNFCHTTFDQDHPTRKDLNGFFSCPLHSARLFFSINGIKSINYFFCKTDASLMSLKIVILTSFSCILCRMEIFHEWFCSSSFVIHNNFYSTVVLIIACAAAAAAASTT